MSRGDIMGVGAIYCLIIGFYILFGIYKEVVDLRSTVQVQQVKIVQLEENYDNALYMVDSLNIALDDAEGRLEKVSNLEQFLKELARIWDER